MNAARENKPHVLIVDDDAQICVLVKDFLDRHGFITFTANNGEEMRDVLKKQTVAVVVLDVMLPTVDGLELCREIRKENNVPIIMLSALGEDTDTIVGLEVGADDYLAKPFNPRELLARIKALLRRAKSHKKEELPLAVAQILFAEMALDCNKRALLKKDSLAVPLSAGEYDLLMVLLANPGKTLSREQLLDRTREREYEPFDRSIDVQIGRLRKKIEQDPKEPKIIVTVRGGGYRFNSNVEVIKK